MTCGFKYLSHVSDGGIGLKNPGLKKKAFMKSAKPLLALSAILLAWTSMIICQEKPEPLVMVIPIRDEIDDGLAAFVDRVLG